ncbi:MAG: hypothetical protein JXA68_07940 [Ignavibacteriales bacterium]|nr:hypothetical protein [Ignavibacteriales bacterium]
MIHISRLLKIKIVFIIFLLIFLSNNYYAQFKLKSIETFTDVAFASDLKKHMEIKEADAIGGGIKIKFHLFDNFSIGLMGGYKLFTVNQENDLATWGWDYWDLRYSSTVRDNQIAIPGLTAEINTFQKMDVIPILLNFDYEYEVIKDVHIIPSFGGGIIFYFKRLYIEETWEKYFSSLDYTFSYTYRNFPPRKSGNPLTAFAGLDIDYEFADGYKVFTGLNYSYIVITHDELGYNDFPFRYQLSIKLGLTFSY